MLKVTGHSDDLIELDSIGDDPTGLNDEISHSSSNPLFLAFSDGTVLKMKFDDDDGIWRIAIVYKGTLFMEKIEGIISEDQDDVVHFEKGIKWCVSGQDLVK